MRALAAAVLLLLAGCVAPAAPAPPAAAPPRGAEEPLLPPIAMDVSRGAEPSILAASDGSLWIGDTAGLVRSLDGGASWQRVNVGFLGGLFTDGWALAEDAHGRIYVAVTNGQAVSLAVTENAGASWRVTHLVDASVIADRPWVAARGDGEVAIVYFDTKTTREACLHSSDAGRTFLVRYAGIVASPNAGNVVFGPDGSLLYSASNVAYRWTTPCFGEPTRIVHGATDGAQIFTQIAAGDDGSLYVAGPTHDNGAMVLAARRPTGGQWQTIVVSAPETRSNTFGTLSAHGGEVALAWYGSPTAGNPSAASFAGEWHVHVARIDDVWGARTIERSVVTTTPNHVGGFCMSGIGCTSGDRDLLDYFMVDHAPDGRVHVAYGHDGAGSDSVVRHASLPP